MPPGSWRYSILPRPWPIMLKFLPIMLLSYPIMLNNMLIVFSNMQAHFMNLSEQTVLVTRVNLYFGKYVTDCPIRMHHHKMIVLLE